MFLSIYTKSDFMELYQYNYSNFKYSELLELDFKTIAYLFLKRSFDILFSLILIAVVLVILLMAFILVYITNKSFPIFIDKRVGYHGKELKVLKFKTMVNDAESNIDKYLTPEQKIIWKEERKLDNDPRTTRIGAFLRKSSIDELPQLFNILIGNMSFVGPRPIVESELLNNFTEEEAYRMLSAKPGATGNWQVYGRTTDKWSNGERKKLVLEYIDKASLWTDFKILFFTIPSMIGFFFTKNNK